MEERKNVWYLVSGILSILACAGYFIVAIVAINGLSIDYGSLTGEIYSDIELQAIKTTFITLLILAIIWLGLSIFSSIIFMKSYSVINKEGIPKKGLIITATVFAFLSVSLLSVIFAVIGLCVKPQQEDELKVSQNQNKSVEMLNDQLNKLKKMYEDGLIDEEEYKKLRLKAIDKSLNNN